MLYEYGKRTRNVLGRFFKFYLSFLNFKVVFNKPVIELQFVGNKMIIDNSYPTLARRMIVKYSGHQGRTSKLCHLTKPQL